MPFLCMLMHFYRYLKNPFYISCTTLADYEHVLFITWLCDLLVSSPESIILSILVMQQ